MELKGKKINFLGDSITYGQGASQPAMGFVSRFAQMTGAEVRNYGIGGTQIGPRKVPHDNPQFNQHFCSRVEGMDPDADIVIVFGGTNDYGHGDTPLGQMSDRTLWSFYGACHTLFSSLIAKYPDKTIVVLTPIHRVIEEDKTPGLQAYVQAEREVAEYYSLPVLDLWAQLGMQPRIPEQKALYFKDNTHPNDAGHEKIACTLKRFMEAL